MEISDAKDHERFMRLALAQAQATQKTGSVPVGAVIVRDRQVLAAAGNRRLADGDPVAHAELLAIRAAALAIGDWRLENCQLYVTLEPCVMCVGAIVLARVEKLIYGAADPKAGAVQSVYTIFEDNRLNHRPDVLGGVLARECGQLLTEFFRQQRAAGKK
ncbi:MAG: nucleoside deaminase [Planctomycetes bacterium]|nr:nucleoside deaminase [Planctomycetota bacterium]